MRKFTLCAKAAALALVVMFAVPTVAHAAGGKKVRKSAKAKFYEMGETLFDGKRFKPTTTHVTVRAGVKFERMFSLKKPQFFKRSFDTARLPVFK